jgi:hypothetical protein
MTSSGFDPQTFWLVAQHLNQVHYHMPAPCIINNHKILYASNYWRHLTLLIKLPNQSWQLIIRTGKNCICHSCNLQHCSQQV